MTTATAVCMPDGQTVKALMHQLHRCVNIRFTAAPADELVCAQVHQNPDWCEADLFDSLAVHHDE